MVLYCSRLLLLLVFSLLCARHPFPLCPVVFGRAGRSRGTTMREVATRTTIDAATTAVSGAAGVPAGAWGGNVHRGHARSDAWGGRAGTSGTTWSGCRSVLCIKAIFRMIQFPHPITCPSPPSPHAPLRGPLPRLTRAPSARRRQTASSAQSQTRPQPPPTPARPSLGRGPSPTGSSARPTVPPPSRGRWSPPAAQ